MGRQQSALRMLPAQHGLQAHHGPAAHVHLGLEEQPQLPAVQGLAYLLDGLVGDHHLAIAQYIEQVEAVAAALLGHVHGLIGMAQQGVGILVVGGKQGHADTGEDIDVLALDRIRLGNGGQHPLQRGAQLQHVAHVTQDQHELVAPQARHHVFATDDRAQPRGHLHQQQVATGMAITVVDRLEAIQIEHAYRQWNLFLAREFQGLVQPVGEERAIGQPSEHVMPDPPLQ